jgi:GH25 family lysozyme M1 (1,4-beta-N-acetylmuramidase)
MRRMLAVLAVCGSLAVLPAPPFAHAATDPRVPGIDVSQWQQTIDWPTVAGTPVRFAFLRATKGNDTVDPTYATNLSGATNAGLVVGAYHRATPGPEPGDAVAEADHFTSVARAVPGDLLPVLDVEETGGLTPDQLTDWVKTWLLRVRTTLGLRAMIYTSPNFWSAHVADGAWFGAHGYPLWIAHWGVDSPTVPAKDWGGRGWAFWQHSSTGTVAGIPTDVDEDLFNGTDLAAARIASIAVATPAGGVVTGPRISCSQTSSTCARLVNPGDIVTLTAVPVPGATFLGWNGACATAGTAPTCTVTAIGDLVVSALFGFPVTVSAQGTGGGTVASTPGGIACGVVCEQLFPAGTPLQLTATADSASGFQGWGGACSGSLPTCDLNVNAPTAVTATFVAAVTLGEDGVGTAFRWGAVVDGRALGGSYLSERRPDASTTFPFRGTAVTLFTVAGPAFGEATVAIDGTPVGTVAGYAKRFRTGVEHRYDGLAGGAHTLTVTVAGTTAPSAAGTRVGVDALRWGGRTRRDPPQTVASWASVTDASASGGAYVISDVPGATASLAFTGTGVSLVTLRGPNMGRAAISVDGVPQRTVSLSAPTRSYDVLRTVTGLLDGGHVVTVTVLGTHAKASTGSSVSVDGWIIR